MNHCKYCNPDSDYHGTDVNPLNVKSYTMRGNDNNNAKAHLSTDYHDRKKIIVKWSWYGKLNKKFVIKVLFCPMCGSKL